MPRPLTLPLSASLLALALTLAGCGTSTSEQPTPAAGSTGTGSGTSADDGATSATQDAAPTDPAAGTVTITDAQGRTVEVPVSPETVVVTDWSAIRTLADLGVEADAVPAANSALPADLSAYSGDIPQVGDVFEPDFEAIEGMKPDLVIVGSRSGNPEIVAEFEKFATVIDMSVRAEDPADVLSTTRERVEQLGQIFDEQEKATALMDDLESQIAELHGQISSSGEQAMIVQVSDGTVAAYGPGSRFGTIYQDFGYLPTDAPLDSKGSHGEEISQEFFVQYNPDVLFVLDRAKAIGDTEQAPALDVLDNGLVGTTTAAKDDRIVEIDGFAWYLAPSAPSSIQQMIDDVRASR